MPPLSSKLDQIGADGIDLDKWLASYEKGLTRKTPVEPKSSEQIAQEQTSATLKEERVQLTQLGQAPFVEAAQSTINSQRTAWELYLNEDIELNTKADGIEEKARNLSYMAYSVPGFGATVGAIGSTLSKAAHKYGEARELEGKRNVAHQILNDGHVENTLIALASLHSETLKTLDTDYNAKTQNTTDEKEKSKTKGNQSASACLAERTFHTVLTVAAEAYNDSNRTKKRFTVSEIQQMTENAFIAEHSKLQEQLELPPIEIKPKIPTTGEGKHKLQNMAKRVQNLTQEKKEQLEGTPISERSKKLDRVNANALETSPLLIKRLETLKELNSNTLTKLNTKSSLGPQLLPPTELLSKRTIEAVLNKANAQATHRKKKHKKTEFTIEEIQQMTEETFMEEYTKLCAELGVEKEKLTLPSPTPPPKPSQTKAPNQMKRVAEQLRKSPTQEKVTKRPQTLTATDAHQLLKEEKRQTTELGQSPFVRGGLHAVAEQRTAWALHTRGVIDINTQASKQGETALNIANLLYGIPIPIVNTVAGLGASVAIHATTQYRERTELNNRGGVAHQLLSDGHLEKTITALGALHKEELAELDREYNSKLQNKGDRKTGWWKGNRKTDIENNQDASDWLAECTSLATLKRTAEIHKETKGKKTEFTPQEIQHMMEEAFIEQHKELRKALGLKEVEIEPKIPLKNYTYGNLHSQEAEEDEKKVQEKVEKQPEQLTKTEAHMLLRSERKKPLDSPKDAFVKGATHTLKEQEMALSLYQNGDIDLETQAKSKADWRKDAGWAMYGVPVLGWLAGSSLTAGAIARQEHSEKEELAGKVNTAYQLLSENHVETTMKALGTLHESTLNELNQDYKKLDPSSIDEELKIERNQDITDYLAERTSIAVLEHTAERYKESDGKKSQFTVEEIQEITEQAFIEQHKELRKALGLKEVEIEPKIVPDRTQETTMKFQALATRAANATEEEKEKVQRTELSEQSKNMAQESTSGFQTIAAQVQKNSEAIKKHSQNNSDSMAKVVTEVLKAEAIKEPTPNNSDSKAEVVTEAVKAAVKIYQAGVSGIKSVGSKSIAPDSRGDNGKARTQEDGIWL